MTWIRWCGNECTSHNFSLFAIFLPKIIKIGGNLTKFWQKQFCTVFETPCRNANTPKIRPTWWPPPPNRWWFRRVGKITVLFLAVSGPKFLKFERCRGPFVVSNAVSDCLCRVPRRRYSHSKLPLRFLGLHFLRGEGPKNFTAVCYRGLPPTVWQSLVEFCCLNCVCEAQQWRKTQNFRRVGENSGPIFSH